LRLQKGGSRQRGGLIGGEGKRSIDRVYGKGKESKRVKDTLYIDGKRAPPKIRIREEGM